MRPNRLQLNTAKTEFSSLHPADASICYLCHHSNLSELWPNQARFRCPQFGIYMDADVSMRSHVSKLAACFAILRQLQSICRSVPAFVLHPLVSFFVPQRLDCGNATLTGWYSIPSDQANAVGDEFCCSACVFYIEVRHSWHSCTG